MASVELEQQQEKLRRVVDEWRCRSNQLLNNLHRNPYGSSFGADTSNSDPIRVNIEPLEHSDILTLVDSDNVSVAKFVTVLSYDCSEISELSRYARRHIYRQLFLFGHGSSSLETLLEGEPQKAFGHSMSLFMELSEISCRMSAVTCNLLQQIDFIYSLQEKSGTPCKSFRNVMLMSAFVSLADGLCMFLILDEILTQNGRIKSYLSVFTRMLNKVKLEVVNFGIAIGDLDSLDQVVSHLERLLDVGLFKFLLQEESWIDAVKKVKQNRKFLDACSHWVHDSLSEVLPRLDTRKDLLLDRQKILKCVALFLFGTHTSAEAPDKRLGKVIMEMLRVVPVIYSQGGLKVTLLDMLKSHLPQSLSSWPPLKDATREYDAVRNNYLRHLNEMHSGEWQTLKDALAYWLVSFQSNIHSMMELSKVEACLQLHFKQIIQGILIASRMQMMVMSMLDLHAQLKVPIRREILMSLCQMVVMVKVIGNTYHQKGLDIIQSFPHIINLIQTDIEYSLLLAKGKLESDIAKGSQIRTMRILTPLRGGKGTDTRLSDSLSLLLISLQMLQGGGSSKRLLILCIALDVLQSIGHVDINYSRMKKLISKFDIIADFQSMVEEVTDCSFLYWRKEMMGTWFSMVYMDIHKFTWLQSLLDAFCDGLWFLKLGHVGKFTLLLHEEEIENALQNEIITPLCKDIEIDLRLHVHSTHLKESVQVNPRKTGVRNLSWYLQLKPLRLPFKYIDIKLHVTEYLNSVFYNHSAMSSYEWKIYTEMRQLATLKYRLVLDDVHLPEHSMENGVDATEITQNLDKFATSYFYNMSNQVFIEKVSSSPIKKTLRVFSVEQCTSSIKTHGLGIRSTAIESSLAFLTRKVIDLSKLLDDNVVSFQSVKQFKFWMVDNTTRSNFHLVKVEDDRLVMGKLPLADQTVWLLERLVCLMIEMGNILGLVRILSASVSRNACSISRFIYKHINIRSFVENFQKLGFTDGTIAAGRIMDNAIESKCQTEEHISCICSFVAAFSKDFKDGEGDLFGDLFQTIPSLIIYLLDSRINGKDNILRSGNVEDISITVDGFVMGVAFILEVSREGWIKDDTFLLWGNRLLIIHDVTGKEKSFEGLQWFWGVSKQLDGVLMSLEENGHTDTPKQSGGLSGLKLWSQTAPPISNEAQKSIDKLRRYKMELEFIFYGLNVAKTVISCN